jgi:hypothetical protein
MKRISVVVALLAALAVSATAIAATTSLKGSWSTTITGKGANTLKGALDGKWTLNFSKSGYTVVWKTTAGKTMTEVKGTYKLSGSTIKVTDKSGPGKCPGTGKYKVKQSGKSLSFTKISDGKKCAGREAVLAHKFTKNSSGPAPQGY